MTPTTAAAEKTRVIVWAESRTRREHLRSLLANDAEVELISPQERSSENFARAVLVVDTEDELASLASSVPAQRSGTVLLAEKQDLENILKFFPLEPVALLNRDCEQKQLQAAIQAVAAGLSVLLPDYLDVLKDGQKEIAGLEPGEEELTPREAEVLQMMTAGLTNREIASALGISEHTVKFHIASIFGKLGTTTRTETVTEGIRRGLILL